MFQKQYMLNFEFSHHCCRTVSKQRPFEGKPTTKPFSISWKSLCAAGCLSTMNTVCPADTRHCPGWGLQRRADAQISLFLFCSTIVCHMQLRNVVRDLKGRSDDCILIPPGNRSYMELLSNWLVHKQQLPSKVLAWSSVSCPKTMTYGPGWESNLQPQDYRMFQQ